MGLALNHPFIDAFSIINQPAIGVPPIYGNPDTFGS